MPREDKTKGTFYVGWFLIVLVVVILFCALHFYLVRSYNIFWVALGFLVAYVANRAALADHHITLHNKTTGVRKVNW